MTTTRRHRRASGAVRKLPSGRWQARYTGPDGALRTLGTFPTKAEADQELAHGAGGTAVASGSGHGRTSSLWHVMARADQNEGLREVRQRLEMPLTCVNTGAGDGNRTRAISLGS